MGQEADTQLQVNPALTRRTLHRTTTKHGASMVLVILFCRSGFGAGMGKATRNLHEHLELNTIEGLLGLPWLLLVSIWSGLRC